MLGYTRHPQEGLVVSFLKHLRMGFIMVMVDIIYTYIHLSADCSTLKDAMLMLSVTPSHVRTIFTQSSQFLPVNEEQYRHRQERYRQKPEETGSPIYPQSVVQSNGEQGKPSTGHGPHECVGCNGAVRVHEVNVDDVAQPLQEYQQHSRSYWYAGDDLWHPRDVRVRRPGEPEEADGEQKGANDHGDQSLLRYWLSSVGNHLLLETCVGCVHDDGDANDDPDGDAEEGECADTPVPSSDLLECNRVRFKEEIEDAVDEGHVECNQNENRFEGHHDKRTQKIFVDDLFHVDLLLVRRGMDCPMLRLEAYLCSLAL